ncbi:MAG: M48 family metalloprotease [Candidatus Cloacimonetes bacterium]|nr:M48 family metalloprotease [Candidatus Cloacimonadota bacterium]
MRRTILILSTLICIISVLSAREVTIRRERTYMRQSPGSYSAIITEVPVNTKVTILERSSPWLKVKYKNRVGYISETATKAQQPRNDAFAGISQTGTSGVTRHSISAGVKGFAERFAGNRADPAAFIAMVIDMRLDEAKYAAFRSETYRNQNASSFRRAYHLPTRTDPDFFSDAQEGFGIAVASVIAELGIYRNPPIEEYVNFVANQIVEASDVTDVNFRVFVLDLPQVNAYACPGGYIFITRGMLRFLENEAELTFVLAHEMAHISRFHGMIETKRRENQIGAEMAFTELDFESPDFFPDEIRNVEEELEKEVEAMFENLIQGRLDDYEREADLIGLLYMARTGYDTNQSNALLKRMTTARTSSNNAHYRPESITARIQWVSREVSRYNNSRLKFNTLRDRYKKAMQTLG